MHRLLRRVVSFRCLHSFPQSNFLSLHIHLERYVASSLNFPSTEQLLASASDESPQQLVTWDRYYALFDLYGSFRPQPPLLSENFGVEGVDAVCCHLLFRVFCLFDSDGDESLSHMDTLSAFTALDGGAIDEAQMSAAMDYLLGKVENSDLAFNFPSFLALRTHYANSIGSLPGGFRLHGRQSLRASMISLGYLGDSAWCPSAVLIENLSPTVRNGVLIPTGSIFSDSLSRWDSVTYSTLVSIIHDNTKLNGSVACSKPIRSNPNVGIAQVSFEK